MPALLRPVPQDGARISAAQMLTRPGASLAQIASAAAAEGLPESAQLATVAELSRGISLGQASWEGPGGGAAGEKTGSRQEQGQQQGQLQQPMDAACSSGGSGSSEENSEGSEAMGEHGEAAAAGGGGGSWRPSASAVATAAYNAHYRPYLKKASQMYSRLPATCLPALLPLHPPRLPPQPPAALGPRSQAEPLSQSMVAGQCGQIQWVHVKAIPQSLPAVPPRSPLLPTM